MRTMVLLFVFLTRIRVHGLALLRRSEGCWAGSKTGDGIERLLEGRNDFDLIPKQASNQGKPCLYSVLAFETRIKVHYGKDSSQSHFAAVQKP